MDKLDRKTFAIGVLSLSAVILFVANLMQPPQAVAQEVVKDRDYQAVTARSVKGGDALYLTYNRTGLMAVFVFDPNRRAVVVASVRPVATAFAPTPGAVPGPGGARGR